MEKHGKKRLVCWEGRLSDLGDEINEVAHELIKGRVSSCCKEDLDYVIEACKRLIEVVEG